MLIKVFQVGRSALWLRIDVPRIKTSYKFLEVLCGVESALSGEKKLVLKVFLVRKLLLVGGSY